MEAIGEGAFMLLDYGVEDDIDGATIRWNGMGYRNGWKEVNV